LFENPLINIALAFITTALFSFGVVKGGQTPLWPKGEKRPFEEWLSGTDALTALGLLTTFPFIIINLIAGRQASEDFGFVLLVPILGVIFLILYLPFFYCFGASLSRHMRKTNFTLKLRRYLHYIYPAYYSLTGLRTLL